MAAASARLARPDAAARRRARGARRGGRTDHLGSGPHSSIPGRPLKFSADRAVQSGMHVARPSFADARGFTMVELLVVILIIGILAMIALPAFLGQRLKGEDSEAQQMVRTVATALATYHTDENTYDATRADLVRRSSPRSARPAPTSRSVGTGTTASRSPRSRSRTRTFTLVRDDDGDVTRSCTVPDRGLCRRPTATAGSSRGAQQRPLDDHVQRERLVADVVEQHDDRRRRRSAARRPSPQSSWATRAPTGERHVLRRRPRPRARRGSCRSSRTAARTARRSRTARTRAGTRRSPRRRASCPRASGRTRAAAPPAAAAASIAAWPARRARRRARPRRPAAARPRRPPRGARARWRAWSGSAPSPPAARTARPAPARRATASSTVAISARSTCPPPAKKRRRPRSSAR